MQVRSSPHKRTQHASRLRRIDGSHITATPGHFELLHWSARRHCKQVALDLHGRNDSRTLMMITTVAAGHNNLVAVGGGARKRCVDHPSAVPHMRADVRASRMPGASHPGWQGSTGSSSAWT